ncbi:MAG: proteasome subunit alpha, partial [Methanomassiliicoccales archaeon]|nr:proteasome subunit alpha [Methanomassiliicoccales archaeon]
GSIGAGRNVVMEIFEEEYREGMDMEAAILLGLKALKKATEEEKLNPKAVEIGIVRRGEKFRRMEESEVEAYVEKANAL